MIYLYKTSQKEIKVNYEIIGEGQPLVMIHGLVCDMRLMKGCMEPIFKSMGSKGEKYKRIYIDLPGMGKSESVEEIASSDKILEVLISFIKDTIDENFLLVGESYGGYLARGILCEMMDKTNGLVLICPVIFPENEDRILPERSIIEKDEKFLNEIYGKYKEEIDGFLKTSVIINEKTYDRYKKEIYSGIKIANMDFIKKLRLNYSFSTNIDKKIKNKFNKPSLFMAGKQDSITGYKQLIGISENYSRGTVAIIDGAGHNIQIEKPKIFEMLIKDWLMATNLI